MSASGDDDEELARLRARVAELESKPAASTPTVVSTPAKPNAFAGGFLGCLGVGAALIVVLVALMSIGRCSKDLAATNSTAANGSPTESQASAPSASTQRSPGANWVYSSSKSAMSDAETKTACVTSKNEV